MSFFRFNHVFVGLMFMAFLCAFVLPSSLTDTARIHAAGLFNPLSYPIRRIAEDLYGPAPRVAVADDRSKDEIAAENDQLRQEVAVLQASVDRLQKLEAERVKLGDLKSLCVRVGVSGNDAGGRDGLILSAVSGAWAPNAPVLFPGGLAGRLESVLGGARVRLLTDQGFAVTGGFVRFVMSDGVLTPTKITAPTPLVQGLGHGQLSIAGMKMSDYIHAGLREGDWVVLDDWDWPKAVQGARLGRIVRSEPSRSSPMFADIRLAPEADLSRLSDVWVMTTQ